MNFNSVLLYIVIFQFSFLGLFLLTSKNGKRISNILLGVFCVLVSLNLVDMVLFSIGDFSLIGLLSLFDLAIILTLGPLLWLYAKSVMFKDFEFSSKSLLHFVPFFLIAVLVVINYLRTPIALQKQAYEQIYSGKLSFGQSMIVVPFYLHMLVYMLLAIREYRWYNREVIEKYSDLSNTCLDWLKFLFRSFTVIILVSFSLNVFPYTPLKHFTGFVLIAFVVLMFWIINRILFKGLRNPDIFSGINSVKEKYQGSQLSDQDKSDYLNVLDEHMSNHQLFLDAGLTLDQLSSAINIKSRILSQVINEKLNISFNEYINAKRVDHAKQLMRDVSDSKMTILEIMYQSGFNSKSSFNTAFKRATQQTPSQFKNSLN